MSNHDVQRVTEEAMTTRHLIEHLLSLDPGGDGKGGDARVLFVCNYGDYHRTQQALPVAEADEYYTSDLGDTAYSQSGLCLLKERDPVDEPRPELPDGVEDFPVILLQS